MSTRMHRQLLRQFLAGALSTEEAIDRAETFNRIARFERERPRPLLSAFARAIEAKLQRRDHKPSWLDAQERVTLLYQLRHELRELEAALLIGEPHGISDECCDVAALSMMISEAYGSLRSALPTDDRGRLVEVDESDDATEEEDELFEANDAPDFSIYDEDEETEARDGDA